MSKETEYRKALILSLMPKGFDNRKSMGFFTAFTGLKRRVITEIINELRKDYPICTDRQSPGGYWIGEKHDIIRTISMLQNTKATIQESITYLEKHLEECDSNEE